MAHSLVRHCLCVTSFIAAMDNMGRIDSQLGKTLPLCYPLHCCITPFHCCRGGGGGGTTHRLVRHCLYVIPFIALACAHTHMYTHTHTHAHTHTWTHTHTHTHVHTHTHTHIHTHTHTCTHTRTHTHTHTHTHMYTHIHTHTHTHTHVHTHTHTYTHTWGTVTWGMSQGHWQFSKRKAEKVTAVENI